MKTIQKQTRKEEILKVAAQLFKEKGYSAVTMRDLAAAMGIKASSLYNHIKSKQDILKEIVIALAEVFTEGMDVIKQSKSSSVDKLKQIIGLHVQLALNNTFEMASLNNDWMHLEDQLDYYLQLRTNYENDFRLIIKSGIESNELNVSNAEVLLFSVLSTLRSLYLWIPKKEDISTELLTEDLVRVLIYGIVK